MTQDSEHELLQRLEAEAEGIVSAKLYRYRSIQSVGNREFFLDNELYFAHPDSFNDPFDCSPRVRTDFSDNEVEDYIQYLGEKFRDEAPPDGFDDIMDEARARFHDPLELNDMHRHIANQRGVLCLSRTVSDILMWSHYGAQHRGFCIEFDMPRCPTGLGSLFDVVYQDRRPFYDPTQTRHIAEDELFRIGLLTKATAWSYEREVRGVRVEGPGIVHYPPELFSSVYLGAMMSESDKARVRRWVQRHTTPVDIIQMRLSDTDYALEFHSAGET